jgi:tetratricopeptide (TPR) repeat protein
MALRNYLSHFARFAIALALITLLAIAAHDSALRGLADWRSARGRSDIRTWTQGRAVQSREQWQRAVDALREALRLAPQDPALWESLGFAYGIGARNFVPAGESSVYTEFALIYFRQASALRPTSPYSWAGIAVMKYRLEQLDEEFRRAFSSVMRLGPWEPGLQLIISDLGLALWDTLDPQLRGEVRENWRRTAVRQADQLAQLAINHGRAVVLCQEALDALKNRLKCNE